MQSIEEIINSEFKIMQEFEFNQRCCDCKTAEPQWGCINHGIFLCLQCAGAHRSMGSQVSIVRSIKMDTWDDYQLRVMRIGGNEKFSKFMAQFGLQFLDISEKYKTSAAEFYRKQIRALANDLPFDEVPPRNEEAGIIVTRDQDVGSGEFAKEGKKNKFKQAFVSFGQKIKKGAHDLGNKPNVVHMKEQSKNFFGKVNEKWSLVLTKTKESKAYLKMKEGSQSAIDSIRKTGKSAIEKLKKKPKNSSDPNNS